MARARRDLEPAVPVVDPEWGRRNLRRRLMNSEPGTPAAAISARLLAAHPDEVWQLVDELGLRESVERHLAHVRGWREAVAVDTPDFEHNTTTEEVDHAR